MTAVFTICCPAKRIGRPVINSFNFAQAIKLPVKVTLPIIIERTTVDPTNGVKFGVSSYAAQPTNKLESPPKPLSSATISGIEVIAISLANRTPIIVPTSIPTIIHL